MLTDVSSESLAAILPLYVTGAMGLTTIACRLIDGLHQGFRAFVRIGGGWVSDHVDRPKWIAFFGYGLSALAKIWLHFATGFAALTAVITVDRFGTGVRTGPRDAISTASSRPENLGPSFGVHRMLDTIVAAVGPPRLPRALSNPQRLQHGDRRVSRLRRRRRYDGGTSRARQTARPGVLRRFSPAGTTPRGISAPQTVVAVARVRASTGFGVLWFPPGRLNAMVIVAAALAVAIPAVFRLLRPLFLTARMA